jgi:hypothetical protein
MDSGRIVPHQTVIVRDGRIAAIGAAGTLPVPADVVRVDERGRYLMQGLPDMHTHILNQLDAPLLFAANIVTIVRSMSSYARMASRLIPNLPYRSHADLRDKIASGELVDPTLYLFLKTHQALRESKEWYGDSFERRMYRKTVTGRASPVASQNEGFDTPGRSFPGVSYRKRVKRSSPHVVISFLHPPSCYDSVIHRIGSAVPRSSLPATSAPCGFEPNDETAIVCVREYGEAFAYP